ncbi:MAG: hypothetical protein ACFFDW_08760 [Candidatus Thorarchaeota archaeon]
MRSRIEILKDIMEIEKRYALEEIDSEEFEKKLLILEQQLKTSNEISEEDLHKAISTKEIPLSANQLIGKVSIEEFLPNYNVPRTFFRHLKVRREIKELERNIGKLKHDIQKIKVLIAEKKVSKESATIKLETLEFDLRLALNRYGAREKYLKRNPTKGDLLKFTVSNFIKFSYGHGISNDAELLVVSEDLKEETVLREKYRNALAELLATVKASQIDIRATSLKDETLPDFKKLRDLQQTINELQDYVKLLTMDIAEYTNCLGKLDKNYLELDESHELFPSEKFGIDIDLLSQENMITTEEKQVIDSDPLLETLAIHDETEESTFFLIDTLDMAENEENEHKPIDDIEPLEGLVVPTAPQPTLNQRIDLEITGMEDFHLPFEIKDSPKNMNELTEQVIYQSFENYLLNLLNMDVSPQITPVAKQEEITSEPPVKKASIKFTSLSDEVRKIKSTQRSDIPLPPPPPPQPQSITPSVIESDCDLEEILDSFSDEETKEISNANITEDTANIQESTIIKSEIIENANAIPSIPSISEDQMPEVDSTIEEITEKEPIKQPTTLPPPPPRPEEDIVKPQKESMISEKLLQASTEAWKLTGKGLFNLKEDGSRDFLGYLQEVVVFDNNQLGFTLVSEVIANQTIIDKIFDQIKPLWVSEELMESPSKRKEYVIQEVVDSLQVQRDIALHVSRLQEFSNFRNINYPNEESNTAQEILGIIPLNKLRIKRGSVVSEVDDLLATRPYRTAPWMDKFSDEEDENPIGKDCYYNHGGKIGKIIAILKHPLMGQLLLIDTNEPDNTLVDYLVDRLEITEESYKEKIWLVKYLIAKQLRLPEGEALKPKTLINYSLKRGFPILPNEILNSYRAFISGGSIDVIKRSKVVLKNSARVFHPSEVIPIECLRVRSTQGRHLGTCLGVSLAEKPVILISERLSRDIVQLFSTATVEKQIMTDISDSVIGSIGVDLRDSLCPNNVLKTLIVGRKIQSLSEYGMFLSKMNVTGIDISRIQVVEKGTIYVATLETFTKSNIFNT